MIGGRRPGEYTRVSTKTEVLIPWLSWLLACVTADIGIVSLGVILMMIGWWVVGWHGWWQWWVSGWQWWVVGLVLPWPVIGTVLIVGYVGEIHFKDAHKDKPHSTIYALLSEFTQLAHLLKEFSTSNSAYEKHYSKDNKE